LYKFQSKDQRRTGFLNGIIFNESYVIGANRNEFLSLVSLIILFLTLGAIAVHMIFRIRRGKKTL